MYKLKYEKYKFKYLKLKNILNQTGGVNYECYFLHPTDITSIHNTFGNDFLYLKINAINEKLIKHNHTIITKNNLNDEDYIKLLDQNYKCVMNNDNLFKNSVTINKILFIIFKLKNKFKKLDNYDLDIKIKLDSILTMYNKYKNTIKEYNINKLNDILNDVTPLEDLNEYIKKFEQKISEIKTDKKRKIILDHDNICLQDESSTYPILNIKIIDIIEENDIKILLILNKVEQQMNEYIDFFIIKLNDKIIDINIIYIIIIKYKQKIKDLCLDKFIPLNIIGILNQDSFINYDKNKKDICNNELVQTDDIDIAINFKTLTSKYQIINSIQKISENKNLYKMFHSYLIDQIKKKINILDVSILNNFMIIATTLQLFFENNKLYYNNGNLEHAEQLLISENNNIKEIYIIKFSYTESNLKKLLNEEMTQKEFNSTLITQCGIPCQSCLNSLKKKKINNIFFSNQYGEIIKLDDTINETYTTNGDIFLKFDNYLYGLYK